MAPEARDRAGAELHVGLSVELERDIRAEDVEAFAALSGDHNPLHLDAAYARTTNYARPIVHGAFQVALASGLIGMHLPGKRVVLGALQSRFPAPLYYPARVTLRGEIVSWFAPAASGTLRIRVSDQASSSVTAEILASFALHEARAVSAPAPLDVSAKGGPLVIVTGANGALGQALVRRLGERFDVLALVRQRCAVLGVPAIECDLEADDWESRAAAAIGGRAVYGLVHAAWPGAPKGGLLDLELDAVRRQMDFGGLTTIRLARWLSQHSGDAGRLVLIGSTAATLQPELTLASYSLGKAVLEHTLRLLAPELARRAVTINAVLPSYMPLGMNQAKPERARLIEAARVPVGRLCSPDDVTAAVEYLLSEGAAFVTGQLLPLTGGRL